MVGAQRIFQDLQQSNERNEGDHLDSVEAVMANNYRRVANDRQRYQQYFHIDAYDLANYDEVVDTTNLNLEQVVAVVSQLVHHKLNQE